MMTRGGAEGVKNAQGQNLMTSYYVNDILFQLLFIKPA